MASLTNILEDLDYYSAAHQTYLRYATKCGPVGNWSEDSFNEVVVRGLSSPVITKGPLRVLGIGSGAGDIDCMMMKKLLPFFPQIHNTIVEPSESQLSHFKERVEENKGDLQNVTFTWRKDTIDNYVQGLLSEIAGSGGISEKYHLIHLVHSLYYTDDLSGTLRVLHGALVERGALFISILPKDSAFIKLTDIQIKHGAVRPSTLVDLDVTMCLDSLGIPYKLDRGTWFIPSSVCFEDNSQDGQHLLDFLTHTKSFRGTASEELLDEVLECLKSGNSKTEVIGELMVPREWVHITIIKERVG